MKSFHEKVKRVFYYYIYPSDSERKILLLFLFMIIIGDVSLRFFEKKEKTDDIHKIDINLATFEDLMNIPGIGPKFAIKILDYRDKKGFIRTSKELLKIKGIGEKRIKILKKYFKFPYEKKTGYKNK